MKIMIGSRAIPSATSWKRRKLYKPIRPRSRERVPRAKASLRTIGEPKTFRSLGRRRIVLARTLLTGVELFLDVLTTLVAPPRSRRLLLRAASRKPFYESRCSFEIGVLDDPNGGGGPRHGPTSAIRNLCSVSLLGCLRLRVGPAACAHRSDAGRCKRASRRSPRKARPERARRLEMPKPPASPGGHQGMSRRMLNLG